MIVGDDMSNERIDVLSNFLAGLRQTNQFRFANNIIRRGELQSLLLEVKRHRARLEHRPDSPADDV